MIQYCNFEVKQEYNRIELFADYFYVPSYDENCSFTIGTPQCWDDTFFERFSMDSHESLHIFTHLVERNNVNRITDYKGVWGLKKLPKGVYSNFYDIPGKRLYFGVDKSIGEIDFRSKRSSTTIIIPQNYHIEYNALFSCFSGSYSDSFENAVLLSLERICALFPHVIALHYSTQGCARMTLMGNNVESLFSKKDCTIWQNQTTAPVFHHS